MFYIVLILALFLIWCCMSFLFDQIGKMFIKIAKNISKKIKDEGDN